MVKSLANGPVLNNKLLLAISCLFSFALGVMGTVFYFRTTEPPLAEETVLHEAQVKEQEERKPFFIEGKKEANKASDSEAAPVILPAKTAADLAADKARAKGVDYFKLAHQVKNFQNKLIKEIKTRFEELRLTDEQHTLKRNYLTNKYDYLNVQKKPWFKAEIDLDGEKINLFLNYYPCPSGTKRFNRREYRDVCFVMWTFIFYKQNWEQYSISSNSDLFLWKDESPYITTDIENLGTFSGATNILKIMFPIADLDEPFHILKYIDGVFSWSEGDRVRWTTITEAQARKFQDDVNRYNTTHSDKPPR